MGFICVGWTCAHTYSRWLPHGRSRSSTCNVCDGHECPGKADLLARLIARLKNHCHDDQLPSSSLLWYPLKVARAEERIAHVNSGNCHTEGQQVAKQRFIEPQKLVVCLSYSSALWTIREWGVTSGSFFQKGELARRNFGVSYPCSLSW